MVLFFIVLIVLLAVSAYVVYKEAEVHELHKMRAAFEDKREKIQQFIDDYKNQKTDFSYDYFQGKLKEIDDLESIIDEELEILKNFDFSSKK